MQFPGETLFKRFASLAFASREFPQSAQMRIRLALRDKELSVAEEETCADVNCLHR